MGRKRSKRGTDSSAEENMAATSNQDLKDSIDSLTEVVTEGFATIHCDMDKLRHEFKTDLDEVRDEIKEIEADLTHNQEEVSSLNEKAVKSSEEHAKDVATLTERIAQLEQQLKQEVDNNIKLEQYTEGKSAI